MKCVGRGWDQGQLLVKLNRLSPREDVERLAEQFRKGGGLTRVYLRACLRLLS